MERCGAVVKRRTRDREVPGSIPTNCKCCFLEQETLSTLLSTGFYPGKKRATWKISTRLLNVLPSINKVDYYYYYYYYYLCFEQKYEKYRNFLSENFHFLVVKFSVCLNRHVFVMNCNCSEMMFLKICMNMTIKQIICHQVNVLVFSAPPSVPLFIIYSGQLQGFLNKISESISATVCLFNYLLKRD